MHRALLNKAFFNKPSYVSIWLYLLLSACHEDREIMFNGKTIKLKPGQLITGRKSVAQKTGTSESLTYRILKYFENEQQITQQKTNKFTIITVINWDQYQMREQQPEQPVNNKRTTNEQPVNTNNNVTIKQLNNKTNTSSDDEAQDEFYETKKKRRLTGNRLHWFLEFWELFDYKSGKAEAADAWYEIKTMTEDLKSEILRAAMIEAKNRPKLKADGKTPKMAQGWLSGRRWEDESEKFENEQNRQLDQPRSPLARLREYQAARDGG